MYATWSGTLRSFFSGSSGPAQQAPGQGSKPRVSRAQKQYERVSDDHSLLSQSESGSESRSSDESGSYSRSSESQSGSESDGSESGRSVASGSRSSEYESGSESGGSERGRRDSNIGRRGPHSQAQRASTKNMPKATHTNSRLQGKLAKGVAEGLRRELRPRKHGQVNKNGFKLTKMASVGKVGLQKRSRGMQLTEKMMLRGRSQLQVTMVALQDQ